MGGELELDEQRGGSSSEMARMSLILSEIAL